MVCLCHVIDLCSPHVSSRMSNTDASDEVSSLHEDVITFAKIQAVSFLFCLLILSSSCSQVTFSLTSQEE